MDRMIWGYICLYWHITHIYERIRAELGADVVRSLREELEVPGAPTIAYTRPLDATTLPMETERYDA